MKRMWLKAATWNVVTELNHQLCAQKRAQHGPTSDGHDQAKRLSTGRHAQELDLRELAELCYTCHRLAPFLNYNGNTFVAIARQALATLSLRPAKAAALRSLVGHIIAGTADQADQQQFLTSVRELDQRSS